MSNAKRGHVGGNKKTGYYYVADMGEQPARRCARVDQDGQPAPCRNGIVWLDQPGDVCRKCGGPLGETVKARRQFRRRGFRTKGAAQDALNKAARAVADDEYVADEDITLDQYLDEYVADRVRLRKMRPRSADLNRRLHDNYLRDRLGAKRLQEIRGRDLDALYAFMLADGRRHGRATRGAGLSPSTVRLMHSLVSGACNLAVKQGRLRSNPAKRASPPAVDSPETPCWTLRETQDFLALPAVREHSDYPVWWTASATGMRRNELLALRWAQVDAEAEPGVIDVECSLLDIGGELSFAPPKTEKGERRVEVGGDTVEVLRRHRAAQDDRRRVMGDGWHEEDLVFPGVDGRARRPARVSVAFTRLVEKVGMRRVTLHSLRHAHETLLLDNGVPLHIVARRMGHDPATMLRHYAHVAPGSQRVAAGLEALLSGERQPLVALDRPEGDGSRVTDETALLARRALP